MPKRILVTVCLVLLTAGSAAAAGNTLVLPGDLLELLPPDPAFILAIASVNEMDSQVKLVEDMFDEDAPAGDRMDVASLFSDQVPGFDRFADPDRPLAVAMGLPNLMAGEGPAFVFIVPIRESFTDRESLRREGADVFFAGDYLAVSSGPGYAPAAEVPELAGRLVPGFVSASFDLEMILSSYGPLIRMGLGGLTMGQTRRDTTESGEVVPPSGMTPDEAAAVAEMAGVFIDSALRLDLALRIRDQALTLHSGFSALPGSPLDPGPQPSFPDALRLTGLLPGGGDIIQTMAMDQTRQFQVFKDFYLAGLDKQVAAMPPAQGAAYRTWVENYLGSVDLFANPLAASIGMSHEGMTANMIMKCSDAPVALERFADLFADLSSADIGIRMKKMPTGKIAGTEVRSWTVKYDQEKMAALASGPMSPRLSGTERLQAEQMVAVLRKVTPNVNMAASGDYLILSADPDPANLAHMIGLAGGPHRAPDPGVAAVAEASGPACQQVITGDLMAVLAWATELMEEIDDQEYAAIEGNPIPFSAAFTIEGADYGADWTMDMPAVRQFVKAMQELEARGKPHETAPEVEEEN